MAEEKANLNTRDRQRRKVVLSQNLIRRFLKELTEAGRAEGTISKYRTDLLRFQEFLGEDKQLTPQSLPSWKEALVAEGYAPRSINVSVTAVNSLYNYIGCRDWQIFDRMEEAEAQGPELTREEYFRMLREARSQENIQLYLLVKVMGSTDLLPSDMPLLTREALNAGAVTGRKWNGQDSLTLPPALCRELLEYARQRSIKSGPIFLNGNQKCHNRVVIGKMVVALGEETGLAPGKANPRNLRRLHLNTLAEYQRQADAWIAERYSQHLNREEAEIGWTIRQKKIYDRQKAGEVGEVI